jgi:hypothetical protein
MAIEGKCEKCGGGTVDYGCLNCTTAENEQLREDLARFKDQGKVACDLFDELKKLQHEAQDLRDLCRSAFIVIRDSVTEDRIGKIEVCTLQGNLWRAANKLPLYFGRCGSILKTTTNGISDTCGQREGHDGICGKTPVRER